LQDAIDVAVVDFKEELASPLLVLLRCALQGCCAATTCCCYLLLLPAT